MLSAWTFCSLFVNDTSGGHIKSQERWRRLIFNTVSRSTIIILSSSLLLRFLERLLRATDALSKQKKLFLFFPAFNLNFWSSLFIYIYMGCIRFLVFVLVLILFVWNEYELFAVNPKFLFADVWNTEVSRINIPTYNHNCISSGDGDMILNRRYSKDESKGINIPTCD